MANVKPENLPVPCRGRNDGAESRGPDFVGKRIDQSQEAWQMPQGGIDDGEDPKAAALRELEEEIGTRNVTLLREHPEWLIYDLPPHLAGIVWEGKYRGQRLKWMALRFLGDDREINVATPMRNFRNGSG